MNDTAKHRINLVLSMDNPMQKKAWDVLTEYPPGSRTGAICQSVDVGVMVQNALLACSAMGLAAVPRAWFEPQDVLGAAGLKSYDPQMAVTVGFPQ